MNRDASLFYRAPGSDLVARHGGGVLPDYSGSAVRRTGPRGAGRAGRSLRHSKSGHGRSSCRSAPGRDSSRKGTTALISRRFGRNRVRHMDDRRDCRDTVPAWVPSTVWGTAPMRNRQVKIGAVLAPQEKQVLPANAVASACGPRQRTAVTPPSTRPSLNLQFQKPRPGRHFRRSYISRRIHADSGSHRHSYDVELSQTTLTSIECAPGTTTLDICAVARNLAWINWFKFEAIRSGVSPA